MNSICARNKNKWFMATVYRAQSKSNEHIYIFIDNKRALKIDFEQIMSGNFNEVIMSMNNSFNCMI